uniref:HDC09385 n=1 Tax=Drosophila melanogaster TaxID=7227 RepID=Q6ILJ1_DROME|nr:TPA_inf: HDC09385 [Drosophila melanogaster]
MIGGSMPNTSSSVPFLLSSSMQSIRSRRQSTVLSSGPLGSGSGLLQQLGSGMATANADSSRYGSASTSNFNTGYNTGYNYGPQSYGPQTYGHNLNQSLNNVRYKAKLRSMNLNLNPPRN